MYKKLAFTITSFIVSFSLVSMNAPDKQLWDAKYWHKNGNRVGNELPKEVLAEYPLADYEYVLDYGCGSGALAKHIARRTKEQVLGIDPSASMINFASGYYEREKNLKFLQMDSEGELLTHLTPLYNFVFSCNVFHLLSREQQCKTLVQLANAARRDCTVPVLLIMAAKTDDSQPIVQAYRRAVQMSQWVALQKVNLDNYYQPHDATTFPEIIRGTGLTLKKMEIRDEAIKFKNTKQLKRFITSWIGGFACIAMLSKKDRKHFVQDMVSHYTQIVAPAADGSIEWRSPRFIAHAVREVEA